MGLPFITSQRSLSDVNYVRFMKKSKVVRVARVTPDGLCIALYPSRKPNVFYGEAFHDADDNSRRNRFFRSQIKDPILLKLLDEKTIEEITKGYETFADNYSFCRRGTKHRDLFKFLNTPTFDIDEEQEE